MRGRRRGLRALAVASAIALTVLVVPEAPAPDVLAVSFADLAPAAGSGTTIAGLAPADIASAYGLSGGTGGTVGIVTAFDNPNLESDLATYRAQWGLPACTTASGCFRKVGQTGTATLPSPDAQWGMETALDVQAVSAACPACSILVVEASSASSMNLGAGVNTAVALGAQAVSASWGGPESSNPDSYTRAFFTHPGVPIVAAAGDSGYQPAVMPASLPTVIAVGGTTLDGSAATSSARIAQAGGETYQASNGEVTSFAAADPATALARAKAALAEARTASAAAARAVAAQQRAVRAAQTSAKRATARLRIAVAHGRTGAALRRDRAAVAAATKRVSATERRLKALRATARARAATVDLRRTAVERAQDVVDAARSVTNAPVATAPAPVASTTPVQVPVVTVTVGAGSTPAPAPTASAAPSPTPTTTPTAAPTPTPTAPVAQATAQSRTWTETAWSGAGSGCSSRVAKPSWQTDSACAGRSVADIAAVADPDTGLAVYDTYGTSAWTSTGWMVVGGTSLAAPLVAAMIVRSGHAADYSDASGMWAHPERFRDVTDGANGSCSGSAICTAGTGWDGPTGLGTPISLASF